jgi:hypothetical protein
MTDLERVLELLDSRGPAMFRRMPTDERSWRGRYLLMSVAVGCSAPYAWFNTLSGDETDARQARALVDTTADADIWAAFERTSVSVADLLPWDATSCGS